MKSICKIFLLALGVYTSAFSHITEITRLPVQDISQSFKESANLFFLKLKTIVNDFQKANRYEVTLNTVGLASGVYIYQLRVNDFITSKKMVLLR